MKKKQSIEQLKEEGIVTTADKIPENVYDGKKNNKFHLDEVGLSGFLEWLITPQDDNEQQLFSEFVDDYIALKNRMPTMSKEEIICEINIQLKPYNLEIHES